MRVLLVLLLIAIAGCGGGSSPPGGGAVPTPPEGSQAKGPADMPQAKVDKPPAQAADADAVAAAENDSRHEKEAHRSVDFPPCRCAFWRHCTEISTHVILTSFSDFTSIRL